MPREIERAQAAALKAAGDKARLVMRSAPGAPRRVAKRPVDVSVRTVDSRTVSVRWNPLAVLVDQPTQPHFIARRGGRGRGSLGSLRRQNLTTGRGRKSVRAGQLLMANLTGAGAEGLTRGAIGIPGIGPRAYARHPGTKGKHFVGKGKRAAVPAASQVYASKSVTEPLRQVWHG